MEPFQLETSRPFARVVAASDALTERSAVSAMAKAASSPTRPRRTPMMNPTTRTTVAQFCSSEVKKALLGALWALERTGERRGRSRSIWRRISGRSSGSRSRIPPFIVSSMTPETLVASSPAGAMVKRTCASVRGFLASDPTTDGRSYASIVVSVVADAGEAPVSIASPNFARRTKRPTPGVATSSPSSTMTLPRRSTISGAPMTVGAFVEVVVALRVVGRRRDRLPSLGVEDDDVGVGADAIVPLRG